MSWREWVPTPEAHARASGRRGYNKQRQAQAQARRERVRQLLQRWGMSVAAKHKMARVLGVSMSTLNRDVRALQERPPLPGRCGLPRQARSLASCGTSLF